tara:strand:- start:51 stop:899 length:849 start_codon:yes stop_codon:yes gene_type:complete
MNLDEILPKRGPSKFEVSKYLKKYINENIVIKCGGSVLDDGNLFDDFISDVAVLKKLNFNPIVIHGGGKKISSKLESLNIKSNFIDGSRVSSANIINIIEDVLIKLNLDISISLKKLSCKVESITSKERNIIYVTQESKKLGFVGKPRKIEIEILKDIISSGKVPIISPLGLDENGQVLNINADTVAGSIAKELKARRLIIVSDVEGVLDENSNLISEINNQTASDMIKNKIISGGMIPKIKNCLEVADKGVKGVVIIDGKKKHSILFELLSDKGSGTLIRK